MSASDIAETIKQQERTAEEITEAFIERIEKINPKINAYCTYTFELAREQARKADEAIKKGEKSGPLAGVPISIKDLYPMKGIRTTYGSMIYRNHIPDEDHIIVQRLQDAGAVILGKTNTPEFGFQPVTDNLVFGKTSNPWNLDRTCGGSSGGAGAAAASGLSPLAQGSDGGGSIRIPSSLCGVYGIKPQYGRVPSYPTTGIKFASFSQLGPLTRYVEDAALMLDVIKGPHDFDKDSLPDQGVSYVEGIKEKPKHLKIGYSLNLSFLKAIDPEVEKSVLDGVDKLDKFGWTIEEAKFRLKNPDMTYGTLLAPGIAADLKNDLKKHRNILTPNVVRIIEMGLQVKAVELEKARYQRKKLYEKITQIFQKYDVLITPTTAVPAFKHGIWYPDRIADRAASPLTWISFTYPFNMTGHPAASIPCGWSSDGLPIGMQIVGKRFDELTVLQASKAFEEVAPWQEKKPPL